MKLQQCSDNRNTSSQTLSRGLHLLRILAEARSDMGVRELARAADLPPPMVQRLVNTLAAQEFIEQSPDTRKYSIGYRAFMVGRGYTVGNDVVEAAAPILRQLVDKTEVNAYVGEVRGNDAIYLLVLQSRGPIAVRATPGERAVLHTTAMGKALLAAMDSDAVLKLLGRRPLPSKTPRSISSADALLNDLAKVRAQGFAVCDEENLPGIFAAGAGIFDAGGKVAAAVSLACQAAAADSDKRAAICRDAMQAAAQISRRLGYVR